jgi:SAM-dependent methyltransferase
MRRLLPLPPIEMRELVGATAAGVFDHPSGKPVFPAVATWQYASILDFGCGCGRVARQLAIAAAPMPGRYLGIDLHRGMIVWDNEHLAPHLPQFRFEHHNVFSATFNPDPEMPRMARFPVEDEEITLVLAISVFTHLIQDQAEHYLDEIARVLRSDGVVISTWFLFDKSFFPMMQDFQNALYINDLDPTNAVIFDRGWLGQALARRRLRIRSAKAPKPRGFQWTLQLEHGTGSVPLPPDEAPFGRRPPPVGPADPSAVGLHHKPGSH